eukprot:UN14539
MQKKGYLQSQFTMIEVLQCLKKTQTRDFRHETSEELYTRDSGVELSPVSGESGIQITPRGVSYIVGSVGPYIDGGFDRRRTTNDLYQIRESDIHLKEEIGHGSFGNVRRGEYVGIVVAIKILRTENKKNRDEFLQEAKSWHKIPQHTNICRFIGVCTENPSRIVLVSE